jgi:hypothetical protein
LVERGSWKHKPKNDKKETKPKKEKAIEMKVGNLVRLPHSDTWSYSGKLCIVEEILLAGYGLSTRDEALVRCVESLRTYWWSLEDLELVNN